MRLLHTSDWHLGRSLLSEPLIVAQQSAMRQIVRLVDDGQVDAVLVSGDVFDRAVPPVEAVELLARTLADLAERVPTVMISGNHDSVTRLGFGAQLFRAGVHVRTSAHQVAEPVELRDEHGPVLIYPIPFLDPDVARVQLAADPCAPLSRSHDAVLEAAMGRVRADFARRRVAASGARCIVMAHAFVVGGSGEPAEQRSDSERDLRVGGTEAVRAEVFAGAHYVALGHLHGPQQVAFDGSTTLRYSGSPLRYSFSEARQTKSVTVVELDAHGVHEVEALAIEQPRQMTARAGSMAELLEPQHGGQVVEDWAQLTVTDAARPPDMARRLRERYPNALVIRHVPSTGPLLDTGHLAAASNLDPLVVVESFVRYVTGGDATAAELEVFRSAYEQVHALERSV
jgi:exonuclease SbcD